ncbi:hypothetical protein ACFL2Q_09130 [Thermodesulfobacteriota bacterium]
MFRRTIIKAGLDVLAKSGAKVLLEGVRHYNRLVLSGDIDRARAEIRVEFIKNRQVATRIYEKYKEQMDEDVRKIYEEMIVKEDVLMGTRSGSKLPIKKEGALSLFKEFITSDQLTPEHITKILNIGEKIVEARIKAGLDDAMTTNRIRVLMTELNADTTRCDRAVEHLEKFGDLLSKEEVGQLVSLIIKKQLGVV